MKLLVAVLTLWAGAAAADCRQALALGLDVSGSVDSHEHVLQRQGLAAALASDAVQGVLFAPGSAPVRLAVYEWSGPIDQHIIVPWTTVADRAALARIIGILQSTPRAPQTITTAIGPAMTRGFDLLRAQPDCWKRTLDLSGDGKANTGPLPQTVGLPADLDDVVVNALVIGMPERAGSTSGAGVQELSAYFQAYVIRGATAFVEVALGYDDYARAMERKLLRELESLAAAQAYSPSPRFSPERAPSKRGARVFVINPEFATDQ